MTEEIIKGIESIIRSLSYNTHFKLKILHTNERKHLHILMNVTESNFYVDISTITQITYDYPTLSLDTVRGYVFIKLDDPHIDIQL